MEDIDYSELSTVELQALASELRDQLDEVYSELSRRQPIVYHRASPDEIKKEQLKATVIVSVEPGVNPDKVKRNIVEDLSVWGSINRTEVRGNQLYITYEDYRDAEDATSAFARGRETDDVIDIRQA